MNKEEYLSTMGITQWVRREPNISYQYLLIHDNAVLPQDLSQLIDRMLEALNWPKAVTRIEALPNNASCQKLFLQKMAQIQPKVVLIFSSALRQIDAEGIQIARLPGLVEILKDKAVKKQAWQVMQTFKEISPAL